MRHDEPAVSAPAKNRYVGEDEEDEGATWRKVKSTCCNIHGDRGMSSIAILLLAVGLGTCWMRLCARFFKVAIDIRFSLPYDRWPLVEQVSAIYTSTVMNLIKGQKKKEGEKEGGGKK